MMSDVAAEGIVFVVSGPSGVGKDSVLDALARRGVKLGRVVTAVTRPPRNGERDGVDYYFHSAEEFQRMVENGELLEWAEFVKSPRGTPLSSLRKTLERGRDAVLKIDVDGFRQVKQRFPQAVSIFLEPPNMAELERRIRGRGGDSEPEIARRLERAMVEMAARHEYDHRVVNDDLERAVDRVAELIEATRARRAEHLVRLDP